MDIHQGMRRSNNIDLKDCADCEYCTEISEVWYCQYMHCYITKNTECLLEIENWLKENDNV
jgi:hypothetical protein